MRNIELNGASPELLSELVDDEIVDEDEFENEFEGLDESLLSSDADLELDDEELDEERRRLRRLVRRRPRPSRVPKRPRRPRPRGVVRPGFRRKMLVRRSEPCICPAHGSEYIRWVQSALNQRMGLNLRVNGVMNPATRGALRRFQQQQGLPSDGIAGPETKRALLDARGGGARDAAAGVAQSTDATEPAADTELFEYDTEVSETWVDDELDEISGSKKAAVPCLRPLGGAPPKGLFTAPMRDGTRWYTPTSGDNLWALSRTVVQRIFANHDMYRAPTGREIATMSQSIKNDPCNAHIKGLMFLPRFKSDRFTKGGQHYGAIHIPAKF